MGKTAKLPRVDISNPGKALGTDTVSSMRSGIYFGYLGQTEYLVRKLKGEAGFDMKTVATAGFQAYSEAIQMQDVFDSDLPLNGINYIYSETINEAKGSIIICRIDRERVYPACYLMRTEQFKKLRLPEPCSF